MHVCLNCFARNALASSIIRDDTKLMRSVSLFRPLGVARFAGTSASAMASVASLPWSVAHASRVARVPPRARRSTFGRRSLVPRASGDADAEGSDTPPPGCSRYEIRIKKPLGLVLEEKKSGGIFVAEIVPDGNAAKTGLVNVGDQLVSTSATVFNGTSDYGGVSVKSGEETIKFAVRGEKFDTVMAAIGSNMSQRLVTLEFQKCI